MRTPWLCATRRRVRAWESGDGGGMTVYNLKPKTPAEYFQNGHAWLAEAEDNLVEGQDSATLAMLAIASALLALCSQFIQEQEID